MRDRITTLLEVLGAAAITVGVFTFNAGAGFISAGVFAICLGYLGSTNA